MQLFQMVHFYLGLFQRTLQHWLILARKTGRTHIDEGAAGLCLDLMFTDKDESHHSLVVMSVFYLLLLSRQYKSHPPSPLHKPQGNSASLVIPKVIHSFVSRHPVGEKLPAPPLQYKKWLTLVQFTPSLILQSCCEKQHLAVGSRVFGGRTDVCIQYLYISWMAVDTCQ